MSTARGSAVDMPMVAAGVPPGFDLDGDVLEALVKSGKVEKVGRTPREVLFYLKHLGVDQTASFKLPLRARLPAQVQVPAASAWEYYKPERKGSAPPLRVAAEG
jgi:hypothetical protein